MSHSDTTAWEKTENAARTTGRFLAPVGKATWRGVRFLGGKTKEAAVNVYDRATDHEEEKKATMVSHYETVDVPMSTAFGSGALSGSGYQQPILTPHKASPHKKKAHGSGKTKSKPAPVPTAKAFGEGALSRYT